MKSALAVILSLLATPALADDRDLCADRPGLGSPPCVVSPRRMLVETGLADWTRDDSAATRTDTVLIADTLVRIGVTDTAELQFGWTPFGHVRSRDKLLRTADKTDGIGDASIGAKFNLNSPDGSGFSIAVQPTISLPIGRDGIGAGDWSAQLIAPVSYDLSDTLSLQATPEIDAAVDSDGSGRHLAYGSVIGLGITLTEALGASLELQALRDDDPIDPATQTFAGLAFAWQPGKDVQFDIGGAAGLNAASPDARLYLGISRRF